MPSTCKLPAITTVPVLSPTPAGSRVSVAGPEIVSEVTLTADPSAPVWNSEPETAPLEVTEAACTAPLAVTEVRLISASRATDTPFEAAVVVTFVPPLIASVSSRRLISSDPESPVTVRAVPTLAVVTLVTRPLASTETTGILVVDPYVLAETPVSARSRVTAEVSEPEPETVMLPEPASATVAT